MYTLKMTSVLAVLSICLMPLAAFSNTVSLNSFSFPSALKSGHATLQLGGYWSYQGKSQHINIDGLIGDTFTVTHHTDSNGLVGIGYFLDGFRQDVLQVLWGVNTFYLPKTSVRGQVVQENLFTNLAYDYTVQHFPVYVMAKSLISTSHPSRMLVLDVGIGPNFMKTDNFSERSLGCVDNSSPAPTCRGLSAASSR